VFAGLILTLTVAALDQNIVSPALPQIAGELGGLEHLGWIVMAFMLTSTVTVPLYGKASDLYGRRPLFVISIIVFLVGSALCGFRPFHDAINWVSRIAGPRRRWSDDARSDNNRRSRHPA
jgi:MFS family permease